MKKLFISIISLLMAICLFGCEKKSDNSKLEAALKASLDKTDYTVAMVYDDDFENNTIIRNNKYLRQDIYVLDQEYIETIVDYLDNGYDYYTLSNGKWYVEFTSAKTLKEYLNEDYNKEDHIVTLGDTINNYVITKEVMTDELLKHIKEFKNINGVYVLPSLKYHYYFGEVTQEMREYYSEEGLDIDKIANTEFEFTGVTITLLNGYIHELRYDVASVDDVINNVNADDIHYSTIILVFYNIDNTFIAKPANPIDITSEN